MGRDEHETLKPETEARLRPSPTETETLASPHQPRRDRDETLVGHETSPRR